MSKRIDPKSMSWRTLDAITKWLESVREEDEVRDGVVLGPLLFYQKHGGMVMDLASFEPLGEQDARECMRILGRLQPMGFYGNSELVERTVRNLFLGKEGKSDE